jgi:hypothetical protein
MAFQASDKFTATKIKLSADRIHCAKAALILKELIDIKTAAKGKKELSPLLKRIELAESNLSVAKNNLHHSQIEMDKLIIIHFKSPSTPSNPVSPFGSVPSTGGAFGSTPSTPSNLVSPFDVAFKSPSTPSTPSNPVFSFASQSYTSGSDIKRPKLNTYVSSSSLDLCDDNILQFNDEPRFDIKLITNDGKPICGSKFIMRKSSVFRAILDTDPECKQIIIEDFTAKQVRSWLMRWHPDYPHSVILNPPKEDIGSFIMLSHKYELKDMFDMGIKAVKFCDVAKNLDIIKYVGSTNVLDSLMKWVLLQFQNDLIPEDVMKNIPSSLYSTLLKMTQKNNYNLDI